ncbi:sugar ABC transporter substrate-binding protein [Nocardia sp. NEAU-G5]|uniref:Sugar ABC transporter substrate-binding protein n=1 Tax=Nocardia albiluteola TaxID=2842303 RepID=A0ABS6B2R8_9NOCA|nr:sugar ABC transporter substrate-binding protein [Nocardia albiluteola]MBU3064433.1 sugar ABC transporter substrate-binding protein [Nocardia albiluteola]
MTLGRRALLCGAGVVGASLLVPALGGCGHDDSLTFFFQANPEEADGRMRVIREFARRHPDIPVRTVLSGPDPMQQMLTFCAGGKCPDVLMAWEQTYAGLADRRVLLDMNTMLGQDPGFRDTLKADSIPALYDTFGFNGGQYALPEQWSGNFLFYNRKLFDRAGITPPDRWSTGWSFDEFLRTAQALTERDASGKVTQWGFVDTWVPYYSAGLFGMNNGTEWTTPRTDPSRCNFADDAFVDGVQFYADLANKHRVAPTVADQQSMSTMDLFTQGKAAMAMGGHWRWSTFSSADDLDFDVTALPGGPRGRGGRSNIGTTGLAIAAGSPRKRQAWEFVKFACGPEGQAVIAESGLFVPVLKSAVQSAGFAKSHSRIRNLDILTSGPSYSSPLPVTPAWERIDALMDRDFGPVLRGTAAANSLRHGLTHDTDEVLRNQ